MNNKTWTIIMVIGMAAVLMVVFMNLAGGQGVNYEEVETYSITESYAAMTLTDWVMLFGGFFGSALLVVVIYSLFFRKKRRGSSNKKNRY